MLSTSQGCTWAVPRLVDRGTIVAEQSRKVQHVGLGAEAANCPFPFPLFRHGQFYVGLARLHKFKADGADPLPGMAGTGNAPKARPRLV